MAFGDLADTLTTLPVLLDGGLIQLKWPTTDLLAFKPRPAHAGPDTLDDERALQLGDRGDDYDEGPAQRTGSVDLLTEADELDIQPVQFIKHLEVVFD